MKFGLLTGELFLILLLFLLTRPPVCHGSLPSDFFHFSGLGGNKRQGKDDGNYYKVLGIDRHASADQIKKAYRKRALQLHPDKGGDAEEFKLLSTAYEVLSDSKKKAQYDRFGLAGLNEGVGPQGAGPDLREFFRGFGGFSMPLVFQLDLTLEDFYAGKEFNIPIDATQQVKVVVEPGMLGGQELVAQAETKGFPRDVIIRLREVKHALYQRKNADLLMDVKVTLAEALLGFQRTILCIDGREIRIQSPDNMVSGPDSIFAIEGLGMPVYGRPNTRGRLFIRTKLVMPTNFSGLLKPEEEDELERLLSVVQGGKVDQSARRRRQQLLKKKASAQGSEQAKGAAPSAEAVAAGLDASHRADSADQKKKTAVPTTSASKDAPSATKGKPAAAPHDAEDKDAYSDRELFTLSKADPRSFGQFGAVDEEEDEDFIRSPFAQYFFR